MIVHVRWLGGADGAGAGAAQEPAQPAQTPPPFQPHSNGATGSQLAMHCAVAPQRLSAAAAVRRIQQQACDQELDPSWDTSGDSDASDTAGESSSSGAAGGDSGSCAADGDSSQAEAGQDSLQEAGRSRVRTTSLGCS